MVLRYDTKKVSLKLNTEKCVGCKLCLSVCPHGVFKMQETKAVIHAIHRCIECGACAKNCPTEALEVRSGVGCAQAYLNAYFNGGEVSCDCDGTSEKKCC